MTQNGANYVYSFQFTFFSDSFQSMREESRFSENKKTNKTKQGRHLPSMVSDS